MGLYNPAFNLCTRRRRLINIPTKYYEPYFKCSSDQPSKCALGESSRFESATVKYAKELNSPANWFPSINKLFQSNPHYHHRLQSLCIYDYEHGPSSLTTVACICMCSSIHSDMQEYHGTRTPQQLLVFIYSQIIIANRKVNSFSPTRSYSSHSFGSLHLAIQYF